MNDNFPAASWATADWYGAPKIGHYFCQDAFAPLHACVLFSSVHNVGAHLELPAFLLDDADALRRTKWRVVVRAYDGRLKEIKRAVFDGKGSIAAPLKLGKLALSHEETDTVPLLVVAEILKDGALADRTFYWVNYEPVKGCLFDLPRTDLSLKVDGDRATVTNTGGLPAVAVNVSRPGHLDTFRASDNYFWLDAGESRVVTVSDSQRLVASAWNA
jgi:beta-mannosidase